MKVLHLPLVAVLFAFASFGGAHAGQGCEDSFEILFSARPSGFPFWLSPKGPFFVEHLPSELETTEGAVSLTLRLKRVGPEGLVAEFGFSTDRERHAALYRLQVSLTEPRELNAQAVDEYGNGWGISIKPLCPFVI